MMEAEPTDNLELMTKDVRATLLQGLYGELGRARADVERHMDKEREAALAKALAGYDIPEHDAHKHANQVARTHARKRVRDSQGHSRSATRSSKVHSAH